MEKNLDLLRASTKWFIDQDPTNLVLTPRSDPKGVQGPGGGLLYPPGTPRASQRAKLISQGGKGTDRGGGGLGSEDRNYAYVVVMLHDGLAEVGDTFLVDGRKFIVESFAPDNGYEVKFYAVQYSRKPTDG